MPPTALLVAPSSDLAEPLVAWLRQGGFQVTLVASFQAARLRLAERPSLLISEVRLGDYNGLHLAMYARHHDIPAIVIGESDSVLEHEAKALGARYLTHPLDPADVLAVASNPRRPVTGSAPLVSEQGARISFFSSREIVPPVVRNRGNASRAS